MTKLILGSRTYAPLSDVTATPGDFTFGTSEVVLKAESLGATRKPLETTRATLLNMATEPDTEIVLYVSRDSATKRPTQGMVDIQHLLTEKGIEFRVVSSPFPGSICELITNIRHTTEKVIRALPGARKDNALSKLLAFTAIATDTINDYTKRMEEAFMYEVGNKDLDDRFIRWLKCYEALNDELESAKAAIT